MAQAPANIDGRLRLFAFTASTDRLLYLWILRVFDQARERYALHLGQEAVAEGLEALRREHPEIPPVVNLTTSLDQLHDWGLLSRTQDAGRVRSIAEYRQRRSTYQLSPLGWQAYRAVEAVVGAEAGDAELRRLVFGSVLEDLEGLADANAAGDGPRVNILLDRLHQTLEDLADRASRFYLLFAELTRAHEARPEAFLAHKERLIVHLRDFLGALQGYRPRLSAAVLRVEATGLEALIDRAAAEDHSVFSTPEERRARWERHWEGIRAWFVGAGLTPSAADRLDSQTALAIRELAALLRRVTEARYGGVSRATQLAALAGWFTRCPTEEAAHALFGATFNLRPPRHLSIAEEDPDARSAREPWWEGPPVAVSTTLRRHGKAPSPGRPAPLNADPRAARMARDRQRALRQREREAEGALEAATTRELTAAELSALLRLLDLAFQSRRALGDDLPFGETVAACQRGGLRLTLRRAPQDTIVRSSEGRLILPGLSLEIGGAAPPGVA